MSEQQKESKIFNLKPQLTLAMKLAATFAITYYGMFFIYTILTLVFYHYSIDSYYFGAEGLAESRTQDFVYLIIEFVLCGMLVFSLIQIFRKKVHGKAIFVGVSILLIAFQLLTTGIHPWVKYALEVLMVLIIAPINIKKRNKMPENQTASESTANESMASESITGGAS